MEGGAKGQVGGMEMSEAERKRLAAESRSWRCQGCGGTTNGEILKAEEERCKEMEGSQGSAKAISTDQVPDELRFGFRDEMGKDETSAKGKEKQPLTGNQADNKDETTVRGESVHSARSEDLGSSAPPMSSMSPPPASAMSMQQTLPTRTTSNPSDSTNGVPGWVDKAIVALVAGLAVMAAKKIAI